MAARSAPRRARGAALLLALVASLVAGCSVAVAGHGRLGAAPDAHLDVIGGTTGAFDTTAQNALADVIRYWTANYPAISGGRPLPTLTGGFYSIDGAQVMAAGELGGQESKEACLRGAAADAINTVVDNAFYCPLDDSIVWDRSSTHLLAVLGHTYGAVLVAAVFAHEFGHALESRLGILHKRLPTIVTESQADCAAGAFLGWALHGHAPHFRVSPQRLDQVLNGYTLLRDSVPGSSADVSHGDAFDRLSALQDGITKGPAFCFSPNYYQRQFTERAYVSDQDYQQGGNESLAQALDPTVPSQDGSGGGGGLQPDLNVFWKHVAEGAGLPWTDVAIAEAAHPPCEPAGMIEFGYCPGDNTVYYNLGFAKRAYYSLQTVDIDQDTGDARIVSGQPADFALGTLFAVAWGLAVRHQLEGTAVTGAAALRSAICYTGVYASTINAAEVPKGRYLVLSPPDMDEATSAMLNLVGTAQAFGARGTSGLERVQSFVDGYSGGPGSC